MASLPNNDDDEGQIDDMGDEAGDSLEANDDSCRSLTDILAQLQDNDENSDDSSFNFDDDSSSDEVGDDEDDYTMEDMFEESVNMHELLPLPDENDPKFPQEDEKYF